MSELKTPEGIFLDLIYLAETEKAFLGKKIPESIFTDYLKLTGSYEDLKKRINNSFDGFNKERLQNEYPPERWPDIKEKIIAFSQIINRFQYKDGKTSYYHKHTDDVYLQNAYQYYCQRTGYRHGGLITTKKISDRDSAKMRGMMENVGTDIILKEKLIHVQDCLEFKEFYSAGI